MLTLYAKTGCPYCAAVLRKLNEDAIPYEECNISEPDCEAQLLERGGKRQVPYLVDPERGEELYESADIIEYLDTHYSEK